MAPVLPRRLAPVLPTTYSPRIFDLAKAHAKHEHSGFPCQAFAHCRVFATAAPRRAGTSFSVSLSGLPLSWPVRILGLVVRYTTNCLIRRRPILRPCVSTIDHCRSGRLSGVTHSFPCLSPTLGQVSDVLLSLAPLLRADLHVSAESR